MIFLSVTGCLLFALFGTFLLGYSLTPPDATWDRRRRLDIFRERTLSKSPFVRCLDPLLAALAPQAIKVAPESWQKQLETRLLQAGLLEEMDVGRFLAYKGTLPLLFLLLWHLLPGIRSVSLGMLLSIPLFFFPDLWLWSRRKERSRKLLRQLPFAMDLLTLSVEAGLDFGQALNEVTSRLPEGYLTEELQYTIKQMRLGMTRAEALRTLAHRVHLPAFHTLTSVLVQADRLGMGIGPALRAQSESLRTKRYQKAEELGAAAAQKILLPLILLVLPSVILLILGAVGLSVVGV